MTEVKPRVVGFLHHSQFLSCFNGIVSMMDGARKPNWIWKSSGRNKVLPVSDVTEFVTETTARRGNAIHSNQMKDSSRTDNIKVLVQQTLLKQEKYETLTHPLTHARLWIFRILTVSWKFKIPHFLLPQFTWARRHTDDQ